MTGPAPSGRVTVVVPVYDDEAHLPQALESLIAQTHGDWEAIVVDDGSSDRSAEVARGLAARDGRIRVLSLERNVGVPAARNRAMAVAGPGELVCLLDSDDYLRPDYLEHMVGIYRAGVAAGRPVGIVACDALIHGPDGVTGERISQRFWWKDEIGYDDMLERNYVFARCVFSRRAFDEVGAFSEQCTVRDRARGRYAASDDFDMWLRIMEAGYQVLTTREAVAYYRIQAQGRSRASGVVAQATAIAYERALGRGGHTARQRRAIRARLRHERAIVARGTVYEGARERRPLAMLRGGLQAALYGPAAFLQAPGRWGEWLGDSWRLTRRTGDAGGGAAR